MTLAYDINSEKWLSIWRLNSLANPLYYETLLKYYENLCRSLGKEELITQVRNLIKKTIEEPLGSDWESVIYTYKNLPALNSMTRSKNPEYPQEYVYKHEIKRGLDKIEKHIFTNLVALESNIRFRETQKIM